MAPKLRVTVDHVKCVGNAMCTELAPGVFALDDDRQSEVRNPEGDTVEHIVKAAENCPVGAITVEDVESGKRLFPVKPG
jgi:ferredoxin